MVEIIFNKEREALASRAIDIIGKKVDMIAEKKGAAVLAIPGGRSIKEIFELFSSTDKIDWSKVHIFWVDDRLVAQDHPDSNYRLAKESFIDTLIRNGKLKAENVHSFRFMPEEDGLGTRQYTREFAAFGMFDIVLLGVGEDCHVAALYPSHHSIKSSAYKYFTMDDSPKPPPDRMTCSRKMIEQATTVFALFMGEGKRDAYGRYLNKNIALEKCPAKLVNLVPNGTVLTDLEK